MPTVQEHFQELLSKHTAGDLPIEREPMLIPGDTEPEAGFKFLAEKGIRACPVFDTSHTIIGTLDLRDSCGFICQAFAESQQSSSQGKSLLHMLTDRGTSRLIKITDPSITELAKQRPFKVFPPDTTLLQVSRALASGSHIVGISGGPDEKGGLSRVVTQGILLKFVAPELEGQKIPVKAAMTSPAVSLKCTDPAFRGFVMMATRGISSIAVVDETGQIIHNLSASDVRLYFGTQEMEAAKDLDSEMEDYLARKQCASAKSKTRAPISVCKEDDDLANVVTKLVKTGYHRVWVVRDKKPVGVLSLTDVFKKLVTDDKEEQSS
eukprot:CAMPEP_0206274000 /NCGR_PEP_ID=MMETSP0047_2-20121206/34913_1 /ASSEMBLY_ACC=CAM_ASM_000192 /TAXON_ID=195065 /ORGANISM="Chroomonas mesostigmatica_cf, Strain CCMP1168" /LENGTH=321 /DNA_ID=CAMNT_0053703169 /DNA_START=84 /DNA_END=1046 /DNA_ORIENTATION=+